MKFSARNTIAGIISAINVGLLNAEIEIKADLGKMGQYRQPITA